MMRWMALWKIQQEHKATSVQFRRFKTDEHPENIRKEAGQTQTFLESTQRAAESKTEELMLQDLRKSNQGILSSSDIPELNTYLQQATTYVQRLRSDVEYLNAKREKGKKLTELETAELERLNERKEKGIMLNKLEESRLEELNDKRRKGENLTDSELKELKEKNRLLGVYQYNIDQVEKRIKAIGLESVWGQGVSLETAGVDKLVAHYKSWRP